ncbi:GCG_CRPN prefix-to-repeats domain-containing protein [Bradyrhizobium iriomotense]|uniref:GCG_CRPN prefix-to-repeats domain-containing protein n=1 Tax=Bradyrhizobium iriomotense TaxID=441950 RepID=UPI003D66D5E1
MRALFVTALLTVTVAGVGLAAAADGCGPGCHATIFGACVADGWGSSAPVRNECPAGAQPRPPCPSGYTWSPRKRACFASY